jgi:hypothetical protein
VRQQPEAGSELNQCAEARFLAVLLDRGNDGAVQAGRSAQVAPLACAPKLRG